MRRSTPLLITIVAAVLVAVPAWAGGGGGGPCSGFGDAAGEGGGQVVLRDSCLDPAGLVVDPGAVVTITNRGAMPHTFTAVDGSFDTGVLQPGASSTVTVPTGEGALPVYCTLHASPDGMGMSGLLSLATGSVATPAGGDPVAAPAASSAASPGATLEGAGIAVAAGIGGLLLGAVVSRSHARRREDAPVT